jgi:hypothetical protein
MTPVAYPDLAPSVCFICESVPPETPFVDTLRTFDAQTFTHLNGRKYICEVCVRDAANALDLFEEAKLPLLNELDKLGAENDKLQQAVEAYASIASAVDVLKQTRPRGGAEADQRQAQAARRGRQGRR